MSLFRAGTSAIAIAAAIATLSATRGAAAQERPGAAPPPLAAYGKYEAIDNLQLSQDGKRVAYIAARADDRYFVVQEIGGPILTSIAANHRKTTFIQFADPDHVLMGIRGTLHLGGEDDTYEAGAIILYNVKTKHGVQIFPRDDVEARGLPLAAVKQGGHLYGYFEGEAQAANAEDRLGLYKTDLDTLASSLEAKAETHTRRFVVGPTGEVLAHIDEVDHGKTWRVLKGATGQTVFASGKSEWGTPNVYAYGRDKGSLLIKTPDDGDYDPPREIDLATGKIGEPLINGAPATPLRDRASRLTIGFEVGAYVRDAIFLDPAVDDKWRAVRAAFKDEVVSLVSYDDGFDRWLIKVEGPHDSGRYFMVDVNQSKATELGAVYPQIKPSQVGAFQWFDYKAQDGTPLKGVLTLPPGREAKNLPLVMMPHGGPGNGSYDWPHFDWWVQALASRGYAVFQPDFRGSGGLGRTFEHAGWGQWGRLMETDVSDAISALAAKGIIDPKRACIVGWSYGGYASLAGVTLQKGHYRCAIAGAGVSDMNDMVWWSERDEGSGQRDPVVRYWKDAMGLKSPSDPAGAEISPVKHAQDADAPILLIHGRDDTVVPFRQSDAMAKALRAAHKTVDFDVLPTSDHWILNGTEANRVAMLEAMVAWLDKYDPAN